MPATPDRSAAAPATLRLTLTGAGAALQRADAAPLPLSRFDAAMLALLALDGATSRQRLLQLLWPDQEPESARNALRQRLFRLRRAAGADVVHGSEQLALAGAVVHDLDHGARGELLGGFDYIDCPELQEWLDTQRRALQTQRRAHDAERIAACERDGRHAEGAALAEAALAAEPLHEPAVRQLMKLHYLAGHGSAALAAYDRFASALAIEHPRARPARETTELLQTVRDAQSAPLPAMRREIPASVLRPPRLVGRDAALAALRAAWSGQRAFWLVGEAGLGKSRLIAEFVVQAFGDAAAGAALVVAARPGDGGVPYASLGRALRGLIEHRPALIERTERRELARVLPELDVGAATRHAVGVQLVLQRAIGSLLHDAQRSGVAAVVFDDLHFADSASLEMLQALVCDDALTALLWGFAQRPAEGPAAVDALRGALEESQRIDVHPLAPLQEAQMHELVGSLGLPALNAQQLAPLLTRHTGGNPMYALETIKHLIAGGLGTDAKLPRPASVGQLIERRLRQLSAPALALARVAAVAGTDFSIELAQTVLDTRALALTDAWRELEAAQVLRGTAFAHDLVYEATLAGVPAPIAAHTHGDVAAFLEQRAGEPARVAAHWVAADQSQRALGALHAAAEAAKHAMRRKEEADFLSRAAHIESAAGEHAVAFESLRRMVEALCVVDFGALNAALFDRLDAEASAGQRGRALAVRANWLLNIGRLTEARPLARAAIDLADAAQDEPTAAYARQRLAQILDYAGDDDGALALLQPLLPWAAERASAVEQGDFYNLLGIVLDNTGHGREGRLYHQRTVDIARRLGEWGMVVCELGNIAISWAIEGRMQRAIDVLREAMQLAAAHDQAQGAGASLPGEMYKCLRDCGRYAEALRWMEPALAAEAGEYRALLQYNFACGWIHLGQHARAQREIDDALQADIPDWAHARALQMRARLKMALGRRSGTLLDDALRIVAPQPGRRYLHASIALDHALTLDAAGALDAARQIIAASERLDMQGNALAGHIRAARFAADAHRPADALAHARAALAIGDDVVPNDLYPAERWLNAWRALRLAGRDDDAAAALRRGASWVHDTRQHHVPEPFRDSFVRANAVNQQILAAAPALG